MIIESGVIVFLGLVFLGIKLPRKTSLRLLAFPATLDFAVTVLALAVHWGSFSGIMAATTAGLLTSGFTSACRHLFGYIEDGIYKPGVFKLQLKD